MTCPFCDTPIDDGERRDGTGTAHHGCVADHHRNQTRHSPYPQDEEWLWT